MLKSEEKTNIYRFFCAENWREEANWKN